MALRKVLSLAALMLVGELIFLLPFVVARIFRPTFLTAFDITNLELGTAFSLYGIVAIGAYFAGGPIADRFSPKKLLPVSIMATAAGGMIMSQIPNLFTLTLLYGFWGITTILLFWAAYVKAQSELGGNDSQGRSFGLIDAGRGFVAAALASSSVFLLQTFLPVDADYATEAQLTAALSDIILLFSGLTALSALIIWWFLPDEVTHSSGQGISLLGVKQAMKRRTIWLQAFILLCSYVGYKCTDDFSLYASDAFGYNDVDAAHIATISFWIRPFAAIAAGLLGDKIMHSKMVICCFLIMMGGSLVIASGVIAPSMGLMIILTLSTTSVGVYGLRGLYYALFQEAKLPLEITGSAAGLVSVIGYTPDIFMGPLMGIILDSSPGELGHQHLFMVLAAFSITGAILAYLFGRQTRTTNLS
ncbi:MAG: MFS transporter [Cytophagales bacterium]|nr:MFS transporter [Cytophagales bacterium]